MAIDEQPRENLMRDAVAYSSRLLLQLTANEQPIFWGLRPDDGWSVYFGEEPVYQFNKRSQLRRAHVDSQRFAARDGKLFILDRIKAIGKVQMQWQYNLALEQATLAQCHQLLQRLTTNLLSRTCRVLDEFPSSTSTPIPAVGFSTMLAKLTSMPIPIEIAENAYAQG